jgi:uncharacterized protein YbjT (DUF2867 family)
MILVTGASGNVGRAVLYELMNSTAPVRALYRSPSDAAKAPAGVETAIADFSSTPDLTRALSGIDEVYLVCSPVPDLVGLESNVIDACAANGVKDIVLNSALGAGDYPRSFPLWHRTVEEKLKASGIAHTILRPNSFMQNILAYYAPTIRTSGAFYGSYGNAKISYLDVRDIARSVAKALLHPLAHAGQVYELNGPEAVSCTELAERISSITRRPTQYIDIPESAQRKSMAEMGMPGWQIDALIDLQHYYTNGQGGEVTDVLPTLLERPPVTLNQFLEEFKDQFQTQAASA